MHTVLITDDNELIRETLQKALVSEGYRVQLAKNGQECLKLSGTETSTSSCWT